LALRDRVSAGAGLAEAMADQPALFDELDVAVAEVGESSGTLEAVLAQLAAFRERSLALRSRIGTALIYPAIVLVMSVMTIIAASLGLASMLRRSSRQRRTDALARLRTRGAVRRHCRPTPSGRPTPSPSGLGETVPDRRHVATARASLTRSVAGRQL